MPAKNNPASQTIVYSYIRYSTPIQALGNSEERQTDRAEEFVKSNGYILDKSLNLYDYGISAFRSLNREKGALGTFMALCEAGKIQKGSILLIEALDRLSRDNLMEAQDTIKKILVTGVNVYSLAENRLYTEESLKNPFDLLIMIMEFFRANRESERKSDLIGKAWASKRKRLIENKEIYTKVTPKWIRIDTDGKFELIPEKVEIIRRIFEMAKDGYGAIKICKILNSEKLPSFKGKTWSTSSIKKILHNRQLIGEYQPHIVKSKKRTPIGDPITEYFPPALDENLFYSVQARFENIPPVKGNQQNISNLFTGISFCSSCKSSMIYVCKNRKEDSTYLVCSVAKKGAGCSYKSVRYSQFEEAFLKFCQTELKDVLTVKNDSNLKDLRDEIAGLQAKLQIQKKKLEKILLKFAESEDDEISSSVEDLSKKISSEISLLKESIKVKQNILAEKDLMDQNMDANLNLLTTYQDNVKNLSREELYSYRLKIRTAIRDVVKEIIVSKDGFMIFFKNGSKRLVNKFINIKLIDAKDWKKGFEDKDGKKQLFEVKPEDMDFAKEVLELHRKRKK